ncbi:fimbrial protein [Kluyvera intermedia]|uniref:fimbrial protein n=1 Tax=Kluyvera intermedia TaxID=61648 RepID=UPI000788DCD4|nr:fimbrial protein [Kluyvera intermedia]WQD29275.1 fimbrial protein [Kluyvera intermedia]VDZ85071.1 Fimbria A protein precursor [Kluyvera intermedia]
MMSRKRQTRRTGPDWVAKGLKGLVSGTMLSMAGVIPVMADTDVEFSGTLVADPCQVDVDSEDQTVDFGAIASKTFINHDQSAPETFHILLKDCDLTLGEKVSVTFYGEKDATEPALFAVTGQARGIALAITDSEGHPVTPDGAQSWRPLAPGDVQLTWQARVQSTAGKAVTEGEFQSVVTFSLQYE